MRLLFIFSYLTFEPRVVNYVDNMLKRGHEVYVIAYSKNRGYGTVIQSLTCEIDGEVFNIGTGHAASINQLADTVKDLTGSASPVEHEAVCQRGLELVKKEFNYYKYAEKLFSLYKELA